MATAGLNTTLELPAKSIHEVLLRQAEAIPDSIAIEFEDRRLTYAEAAEKSLRFASALRELGIQPGDRVGIMLPNLPEYLFAYYGCLMAGAVVVLYNVMLTPDEIEYLCRDSGTKAIIAFDLLLPNIMKGVEGVDTFEHCIVVGDAPDDVPNDVRDDAHCFHRMIESGDPDFTPEAERLEELALLVYTSGTTGKPKGAMLSHFNVLSNMAAMHAMRPPEPNTKVLLVLPLFHVFGLIAVMNMVIMRSGTVLLQPRFEIEPVIDALKNGGVTTFSGTPTMFFHILNHASSQGATFPDLTRAGSGGAALPVEIRAQFTERFGIAITEGYGLSESTVSLCGYAEGLEVKTGSIGQPNPGVEMKIVDDDGKEVRVDEVGEIIARGPNIMLGYWNKPEESKKALRDGWLFTGDLGYVDSQGYFFIIDRKKDMIIKGGYNIYPREIEEVVYVLPQINMAAVIGVPDLAKGEEVHLIVSLKEGQEIAPAEISAHLKEKLAKYKMPKSVTIVPEIPTGPTGKILKRELRDRWEEISSAQ